MSDIAMAGRVHVRAAWPRRIAAVLVLVTLADWLFYGHAVGVSVAVFTATLALGAAMVNGIDARRRDLMMATVALCVGVAPTFVEPSSLSVAFAALGAACAAKIVTGHGGETFSERVGAGAGLLIDGVWRLASDLYRLARVWSKGHRLHLGIPALIGWIVPLLLCLVFLLLFASANPLIEGWLAHLYPRALLAKIDFGRIVFWAWAVALVWPFAHIYRRNRLHARARADIEALRIDLPPGPLPEQLFGHKVIVRSLILFNALFAVQSVLDLAYLWGGAALPADMSYAVYAHRGAYPLVITALLAAAFVLAAMRPGCAEEQSPLVRALVFAWVGQNVLLVISSILRLDLYVETYSLTWLRLAAFVWMLLVAAGLVLIIGRIVLGRRNAWLVRANLVALALTLYGWSFLDTAGLIADYNVTHSHEMTGQGVALDAAYLTALGPHAIPAVDRFVAAHPGRVPAFVAKRRDGLAVRHLARMENWRAWSFRDARLSAYLRGRERPADSP